MPLLAQNNPYMALNDLQRKKKQGFLSSLQGLLAPTPEQEAAQAAFQQSIAMGNMPVGQGQGARGPTNINSPYGLPGQQIGDATLATMDAAEDFSRGVGDYAVENTDWLPDEAQGLIGAGAYMGSDLFNLAGPVFKGLGAGASMLGMMGLLGGRASRGRHVPGSLIAQEGAMTASGDVSQLGREIPGQPVRTIEQMMDGTPIDYSIPNLSHEARMESRGANSRGQLSASERSILNDAQKVSGLGATKSEIDNVSELVRDAHRKHAIKDGWQPFELATIKRGPPRKLSGGGEAPGELSVTYKGAGFEFGKGKITPEQRMDLIDTASTKMVDEIMDLTSRAKQGDQNAHFILGRAKWYSESSRLMHDIFGDNAGKYARLQGAMSPNTRLSQQDKMADEFFQRALKGDFDKQADALREHLASGKKLMDLPDKYIPRKLNGKKYGQNGKNGLMVLIDQFDKLEPGQAPKMRNFAKNFTKESTAPTIDVWAGRTVQRLAGYARPIPFLNKVEGGYNPGAIHEGVSMGTGGLVPGPKPRYSKKTGGLLKTKESANPWADAELPEISGAYGVGVEVFEDAAQRLGMDASDLQAVMWFREKELWEAAGHTNIDKSPDLATLIKDRYGDPSTPRRNQ